MIAECAMQRIDGRASSKGSSSRADIANASRTAWVPGWGTGTLTAEMSGKWHRRVGLRAKATGAII